MHWLPTYMKSSLNAEHKDIMYTAAPYILNSIAGVGESSFSLVILIHFLSLTVSIDNYKLCRTELVLILYSSQNCVQIRRDSNI